MRNYDPKEFKVVALRDCPVPEDMKICHEPPQVAEYWRMHIATHPHFNPECECVAVLLLNARKRVKGHQLISIGTIDAVHIHPREIFRAAIVMSAASLIVIHNHPSGEAAPSQADIAITRDIYRAGQLLKIEVLDHVIIGNPKYASLRELGYCAV